MLGPDPNKELSKDSTRLVAFLQECLALGSLQGFKHFETFIRGREELIVCVYNKKRHTSLVTSWMPEPVLETYYSRNQVSQWRSPQWISPLDKDLKKETERTVFLVAGYAKYRCPYIWLRSHHKELIHSEQREEEDNPLQLVKTTEWKSQNVALWEIISEILSMTIQPSNPFELDFNYIDKLPLEENVILTGAMLTFLEQVWIEADPSIAFVDKLHEDMEKLRTKHLQNMYRFSLKSESSTTAVHQTDDNRVFH